MNPRLSLLGGALALSLVTAAPVTAQLARGDFRANQTTLRGSGIMRQASKGGARIVAPLEKLRAEPAKGLAATANLAYAAWVEKTSAGWTLKFRRSTTGGFSWEKHVVLFNQSGTGRWDFEQFDIAATGHKVFIAMSTAAATAKWPNDVYLLASDDQGQSWTKPLKINTKSGPQGRDADSVRIAASLGRAHVAYFFSDTANKNNQLWYVSADVSGGSKPVIKIVESDKRVNVDSKMFAARVGYFEIDAFGPLVAITYSSPHSSTNYGNLFVAVATDWGKSIGTAGSLRKLTSYSGTNVRLDQYWEPSIDVSGPNVYVTWLDNSAWPNSVFFSKSNDLGKTFSKPVNLNPGAKGFDADKPVVKSEGSTVIVAWHDDRDGNGNRSNTVYYAVDQNSGKDFAANKFQAIRLDGTKPLTIRTELPTIAIRGEYAAIVYEKSRYNSGTFQHEDLYLIDSFDRGKTWSKPRAVTKRGSLFNGSTDIDNPQVEISGRGDVIVHWADNRNGGNDLFISGYKMPKIRKTATGIEIQTGPARAGDLAGVFFTTGGTAPPISLDDLGFKINFVPDQVTQAAAGLPGTILPVDRQGFVRYKLPDTFGLLTAIGIAIDSAQTKLVWFTDPMKY